MFSAGFTRFPCPPTPEMGTEHESPFSWGQKMNRRSSNKKECATYYRHMTEKERVIEYEKIKRLWIDQHGYGDQAAYESMIKRACEALGI